MAIRKLLLPLTGTAAGEAALATALMTARIWTAHVTALHVRVDSRDVAPLAGEGLSGAMIEEMMSATEKPLVVALVPTLLLSVSAKVVVAVVSGAPGAGVKTSA